MKFDNEKLFTAIMAAGCLIIALCLALAHYHKYFVITFPDILAMLFPLPNYNGFIGADDVVYGMINYALIVWVGLMTYLNIVFLLFRKIKRHSRAFHIDYELILKMMLGIVCIIFLIQTTQHIKHVGRQSLLIVPYDQEQKKRLYMDFPYEYASVCRQFYRKGDKVGKLITDIDLESPEGMTAHRRLAYYLLPINIRSGREERRPDYLIFFRKSNAKNYVPEEYQIMLTVNECTLLALRRDLL